MSNRILVVEDDTTLCQSMVDMLEDVGYQVDAATNGETALHLLAEAAGTQRYDVVITDLVLGAIDGIAVLQAARRQDEQVAVIVLTGYGSMDSAIAALRASAFEYLLKPCPPPDLLRCVADAVRRRADTMRQTQVMQILHNVAHDVAETLRPDEQGPHQPHVISSPRPVTMGALHIDTGRQQVSFAGETVHLTPIEYLLLYTLAEADERVLGYCEIARRTHGAVDDKDEAHALLKPHVHNLRRKISPDYLVSVRGTGYALIVPDIHRE